MSLHHVLYVNEVFGPTVQGEGPSVGRPATFLRLAGCNLKCAWCDTPYAWDWSRHDRTVERRAVADYDLMAQLSEHGLEHTHLLVVTGGEPMLQQRRLWPLLQGVAHRYGHRVAVEIETAGTIAPDETPAIGIAFNVSPKLASSMNSLGFSRRWPVLEEYARMSAARFKFVVRDTIDMDDMLHVVKRLKLEHGRVWVMPEGRDAETWERNAQAVVGFTIEHGFRLSPRLHLNLWGTTRGH